MVLRYCSSEAEPRAKGDINIIDLRLGSDPSICANWQNPMANFLVSPTWTLSCTYQSECPKSRRSWGGWQRDYMARSSV